MLVPSCHCITSWAMMVTREGIQWCNASSLLTNAVIAYLDGDDTGFTVPVLTTRPYGVTDMQSADEAFRYLRYGFMELDRWNGRVQQ